jgi:hypothetical protein
LLTRVVGRKSLFEGAAGDPVTVEELVLEHFAMNGNWKGKFVWFFIFYFLLISPVQKNRHALREQFVEINCCAFVLGYHLG